jgi:hypothetical protein
VDRVAAILASGEELTSTAMDRMFYGHKNIREIRGRVVELGLGVEVSKQTGGRSATVLTAAGNAEKAEKARSWWVLPDFLRSDAQDISAGQGTSSAYSAFSAARSQGAADG